MTLKVDQVIIVMVHYITLPHITVCTNCVSRWKHLRKISSTSVSLKKNWSPWATHQWKLHPTVISFESILLY